MGERKMIAADVLDAEQDINIGGSNLFNNYGKEEGKEDGAIYATSPPETGTAFEACREWGPV